MSKKDAINVGTIALGVAALFAGPGGALAAYAGIIRAAGVGLTLYGMYTGYRESKKAQRAMNAAMEDRSITMSSIDSPKSVVYGRRIVRGRPVFVVEPRNGTSVGQPNYYFWMVYALEPAHEIEEIEEIFFNGEPVGPWAFSITASNGSDVAPGSKYWLSSTATAREDGNVPPGGVIYMGDTTTNVLSVTLEPYGTINSGPPSSESSGYNPNLYGSVYMDPVPPFINGAITVPAQYAGWMYRIDYQTSQGFPFVHVWGYRGTNTQSVNPYLQQAEPAWNNNCRLLGNPYLVIRIDPEADLFPSGAPVVTALIRGKKIYDPWNPPVYTWSQNPAYQLYDYLIFHCGLLQAEINMPMLLAARNVAEEQVQTHVQANGVPYLEARFSCHCILSTEESRVDNIRIILAAMGGSMTFAAGQYDVRAGVAEAASGSLNESQLGSGDVVIQPRPSIFELFNGVRGMIADWQHKYVNTDYPPYQSGFYLAQDSNNVSMLQIDFAGVTSPYQAQRVARVLLHIGRNALSFEASWNLSALAYSPGQVINVTMSGPGWTDKPFRILRRSIRDNGEVMLTMKEEPSSVYSWTYLEGRDPDPAPNTNLESAYSVREITGLRIVSGIEYTEFEAGGQVKPNARIEWDLSTSQGVLYGGHIDLWYRWGEWNEWEKVRLPGTTIRYDIPIRYAKTVVVQLRGVNSIQIAGPWSVAAHTSRDAPTGAVGGVNSLANPTFQGVTYPTTPAGVTTVEIPHWLGGPTKVYSSGVQPNGVMWAWYGSNTGLGVYIGSGAYFELFPGSVYIGASTWVAAQEVVLPPETSRFLAFADINTFQCEGAVAIDFLTQGGTTISRTYSEWIPDMGTNVNNALFERAHVFANVPDGAYSIRFLCFMRVVQSITTKTRIFFRSPFLGPASPNQMTMPDWIAIPGGTYAMT